MLLVNPSRRQLNNEVIKIDQLKRKLEINFERDLNIIFRRILKDLKDVYPKVEIIPSRKRYKDDIDKTIKKYMIKTSEIFSGNIRDKDTKSINFFERKAEALKINEEEDERIEDEVSIAMLLWIDKQSIEQTEIILDTNEREIKEAIRNARKELSEGDKVFSRNEIVSLAILNLKNKFVNRSKLIALQNIGSTASEAKLKEAEKVNKSSAIIEGVAVVGLMKKTWNSMLDNRTRPAHAEADSRYHANPIPITENFIVMGESLKYPRDPNGSAENIMRCRCEDQYFVLK